MDLSSQNQLYDLVIDNGTIIDVVHEIDEDA